MPKDQLNLYSWNVNGIRSVHKKGFLEWVEREQPDVFGLQETKISDEDVTPELRNIPGYVSYWSHAEKKGYSGTAIFAKEKPLNFSEGLGVPMYDTEGRTVVAEFADFVMFNIYFPNGQRGDERLNYKMGFYDAFLHKFNETLAKGKPVVVCGDFNTAHQPIDLARPKENANVSGFLPIERAWMDKFVAEGYLDTFRVVNPHPDQYSWWNVRTRARERNVGWRIDYFFMSPNLEKKMVNADIHQDVFGSDHCPVSLSLKF